MRTFTAEQLTRMQKFLCFKCGDPAAWYMLHDELWRRAWPAYRFWTRVRMRYKLQVAKHERTSLCLGLCFKCVERGLGRALVITDFPDMPINYGILYGYAMGRREVQKSE